MNKKLFAWFVLTVVAIVTWGCGAVTPPIIVPPAPRTFTLIVHVCDGPCARDQKIPGAALQLGGTATTADGAGNAEFKGLLAGAYEVCAEAAGFVRQCSPFTVSAPNQEMAVAMDRAVAPTLPIRVDGRFFVTDAGTFRARFQSGLSILARPPPARDAFLDETVALGFNGIRVFAGDLGWAGQTPASARDALPALLEAAQARGLYVDVSALTGGGFDVESHLRAIVAIVAAHPNAILEVANEIGHATQSEIGKDMPRLLDLARRSIPVGVVWTLGAPDGPYKTDEPSNGAYVADGGSFNDAHLDRGRDTWNQIRRLREIAAISETTRKPAMSGEPIGAAEVADPGKRRNDPEFFFAMGALCRGFELGCVFHSEAGLQAGLLGPEQRKCAAAFIAGWRAIETQDRLQFFNAGWPGSPVTKANFDTGITRAYSFLAGGRGWTVLVGRVGEPSIEWGGGWRPVGVVADIPGVRIIEITR